MTQSNVTLISSSIITSNLTFGIYSIKTYKAWSFNLLEAQQYHHYFSLILNIFLGLSLLK